MELKIEWSHDESECDDCGTSWSKGATATLDGVKITDRTASASCLGSTNVELVGVLLLALNKLGCTVTSDDGEDLQWYMDTCFEMDSDGNYYNPAEVQS